MDRRAVFGTFCGITLSSGVAAVIGATALQTGSPYFDMLIYGGVAAIMVGALGLVLLFLFPTKPTPTEPPAGGVHVTSHNQLGGITAHSVNVDAQPIPRDLSEPGADVFKQELLAKLSKQQCVRVDAPIGDIEARSLQRQIANFLKGVGFEVNEVQAFFQNPLVGVGVRPGNRVVIGHHPDLPKRQPQPPSFLKVGETGSIGNLHMSDIQTGANKVVDNDGHIGSATIKGVGHRSSSPKDEG